MAHSPLRIGRPPSWKEVEVAIEVTPPMPPFTYFSSFSTLPTVSSAAATCGSLNGISWLTHWS